LTYSTSRVSLYRFQDDADNPYRQEPYRSLWEKGWKTAQRQYSQNKRLSAGRGNKKVQQTFAKPLGIRLPAGSRFEVQKVRKAPHATRYLAQSTDGLS
jgi:hypothetical protein